MRNWMFTGVLAALACEPRAIDPQQMAGLPTSELMDDPEVAKRVDALAAEGRVESSHIGAAGSPSTVWAKAVELGKAASVDQRIRLLDHQSPAVRVYMAGSLCDEPTAQAALSRLATDASTVPVTDGCDASPSTVAAEVSSRRWCTDALAGKEPQIVK